MDDTTVDGSNDDEDNRSDDITEDDETMADEMKDGSDVKDENSDVGSGAGSRVLRDDWVLLSQGRLTCIQELNSEILYDGVYVWSPSVWNNLSSVKRTETAGYNWTVHSRVKYKRTGR